MKSRTSKTLAIIASLAIVSSSFMSLPVYAEDEPSAEDIFNEEIFADEPAAGESSDEEIPDQDLFSEDMLVDDTEIFIDEVVATADAASVTDSYSDAQKAAYDMITAACDEFLYSDKNISTIYFKSIILDTALSKDDIETIVSDIKKSGSYPVLNSVGLFSTTGDKEVFDKIFLATKPEYRTAAGRAGLKKQFSITSQPADVTVAVGGKATFTVGATGEELTYQWQVSTDGGKNWKNTGVSGNKTSKITITAVSGISGYQYRCIVTDSSGKSVTSEVCTLTVSSVLAITSQPASATVESGKTQSFEVKASGSGLTYQWQVSTDGGKNWKNTGVSGNKTSKITITAVSGISGYQYRCIVTDSSGKSVTSEVCTLTVSSVLAITSQPASATVESGKTQSFEVKASGSGLTYQWQVSTDGGKNWKNTGVSGNKTSKITITAVSGISGYQYRCIVTDSSGKSVTSDVCTLTVK